jgi:hypothetical protein
VRVRHCPASWAAFSRCSVASDGSERAASSSPHSTSGRSRSRRTGVIRCTSAEPVKVGETASHADLMSASGDGSLIRWTDAGTRPGRTNERTVAGSLCRLGGWWSASGRVDWAVRTGSKGPSRPASVHGASMRRDVALRPLPAGIAKLSTRRGIVSWLRTAKSDAADARAEWRGVSFC